MNILFVSYTFAPHNGGVQQVTNLLAQSFLKRSCNVYYLYGSSTQDEDMSDIMFPVYCMDKKLLEPFDKDSKRLYQHILEHLNIDIVICQYPIKEKSDFFLQCAGKNVKTIACYHGNPFGYYRYLKYVSKKQPILGILKYRFRAFKVLCAVKKRFRSIIDKADKVCLLSDKYKLDLKREIRTLDYKKICSINNPYHRESIVDFSQKQNTILFVGRITDPVKNVWDLLKVWERLQFSFPDWDVKIVGDNRNCENYIKYISDKGLHRIEFCGFQKNVYEFYDKAKILCSTSSHEGWPMVIMEAMGCGCVPCVYDTYGAVHDLISDGIDGFICAPYDLISLEKALRDLMTNNHRFNEMSQNAKHNILRFSLENTTEKWFSIFNDLMIKQ